MSYSAETASELAIVRAAADAHRQYGKSAVPNYVISKSDSASDILEVAFLIKEAGLLRPRDGMLDVNLATTDLDDTFERLQGSDAAEVVQEPTDQPYGIRDCSFRDPSGNLIRIQELR